MTGYNESFLFLIAKTWLFAASQGVCTHSFGIYGSGLTAGVAHTQGLCSAPSSGVPQRAHVLCANHPLREELLPNASSKPLLFQFEHGQSYTTPDSWCWHKCLHCSELRRSRDLCLAVLSVLGQSKCRLCPLLCTSSG